MNLYKKEFREDPPERVYSAVYSPQIKPAIPKIVDFLRKYGCSYVNEYFDYYVTLYNNTDVSIDIDCADKESVIITSQLVNFLTSKTSSYHLHHYGAVKTISGKISHYKVPYYTKRVKTKLGW